MPSQNDENSVAESAQVIDSLNASKHSNQSNQQDEETNLGEADLISSSYSIPKSNNKTVRETSYVEPEPEPKSQPRPKPQARPKPEPKPPSRKRRAPAPMPVGAEVGDQVFDLEGQTLAGFEMRISEFRGSIVLLDFWNPG